MNIKENKMDKRVELEKRHHKRKGMKKSKKNAKQKT